MKVAVHSEDIDGISCAALFLLIDPKAEIKFLTVQEANSTEEEFDFIADLPKCKKCKVNIDHHKSNYEQLIRVSRLTKGDLIDISSPSAALLVMKYFNLQNPIAKEIVDMANKADRGILNEKTQLLDKVIKLHIKDQQALLKIAKALAKFGARFEKDKWLSEKLDETAKMLAKYEEIINSTVRKVLSCKAKYVVFDVRVFPFFVAKDFAQRFAMNGGPVGISVYIDPISGEPRCSIRVSSICDFDASKLAEKLGGGGHKKAAGAIIGSIDNMLKVLVSFVDYDEILMYVKVRS